MVFINAKLILKDAIIQHGYLITSDGKIDDFGNMQDYHGPTDGQEVLDCGGYYLSPGFIDIHTHGGGGCDFMDGDVESMLVAARTHLKHGTTTIYPTTLTSTDEALYQTIDNFRQIKGRTDKLPHMPGLHLEGPYFNPLEKGAQPDEYIQVPTPEHYLQIVERAEGSIKRWTIAPELPGALEMADALIPLGIMISAGHTAATFADMEKAVAHGITHLTHFYSGMSSITRKDGFRIMGVVESGYMIDSVSFELIADGIHLPPELLKLILKLKRHDKICLCTDSMRGAGMPEGESILGPKNTGMRCLIESGVAKMMNRSGFAGSVATTDRLVRVMVYQAGLSLPEAIRMMSYNPAKFMQIEQLTGSIERGKAADLVLFDDNINIKKVYVDGIDVS